MKGQNKRRGWSAITGKPTTLAGLGVTDVPRVTYSESPPGAGDGSPGHIHVERGLVTIKLWLKDDAGTWRGVALGLTL